MEICDKSWIDFRTRGQVLLLPRLRPNNFMASKEKCVGDMILPYLSCFTLKLFSLYGYVIFLKQPSWSKTMYTEHWRKLARTTFLGHFVILFVQVCGSILNSCLHECGTVFPIKSMFSQNIWLTDCFDFLF